MFRKIVLLAFVLTGSIVVYSKWDPSRSFVVRKTIPSQNPEVNEKVLICGVCRNIEKAVPNTVASIRKLGEKFLDYRAVVYENNSTDQTKKLLSKWAESDPHVIYISEQLSTSRLAKQLAMKKLNRTEKIARARNIVLDVAMDRQFDDYKYVIWADLDFLDPWDVDNIVETILHPEHEWDAVFANGAYDLFALRSKELPIGYELIGSSYWAGLKKITDRLQLSSEGHWMSVYSAFGGIGIYKREAMRGSRYSGVVTPDLEKMASIWLAKARREEGHLFLKEYDELIASKTILDISEPLLGTRKNYPKQLGIRLNGGKLVWFSCTEDTTLPWTCEHVPFHASMALHGYSRFYINPKIRVNP